MAHVERRRGSGDDLTPFATTDWPGLAVACMFFIGILSVGIVGGTVLANLLWMLIS